MSIHSFNVEDAKTYGLEQAILLYNIRFWLEKNRANKKQMFDGYFWTYNSASAFELLFPYMKRRSIANYIKQLCDAGVLIVGNYNETKYDRTQWYTIPSEFSINHGNDSIVAIGKNCQSNGNDCQSNGNDCPPIPDINTDSKPVSKPDKDSAKKTVKQKSHITQEWNPSDRCYELIGKAGISDDFAKSLIDEFIFYWEERGDRRSGWDATFLNYVKLKWDKGNYDSKTYNTKNSISYGNRPSLVDQAKASEDRVIERMRREAERSVN